MSLLNLYCYCAVPENIHTNPKEGHLKFRGEGGVSKAKIFNKGKYEAKLEFSGGVWMFSGNTDSCSSLADPNTCQANLF